MEVDVADVSVLASAEAVATPATVLAPTLEATTAGGTGAIALRTVSPYERFLKPVVDRVGAAVLLVLALPIMALIAVAVAVSLGAPILFVQERVGHGGRRFRMLKFRSMIPDRRRGEDPRYIGPERRRCHKVPDDPRIAPVGRFIRRWSLDELPQLWNVLRGDMSLVGPRPELPSIVDEYEPWQHARHSVKPGITGPWQITERGAQLMHECTRVDLTYVRRITFLGDLRILALTLPAALGFGRPCRGH